MDQRWIGLWLAVVSVVQLALNEYLSSKTESASKRFFEGIFAKPQNVAELQLPTDAPSQRRIVDEFYREAGLAIGAGALIAAESSSVFGLGATAYVANKAGRDGVEWVSGVGAVIVAVLVCVLLWRVVKGKVSGFPLGEFDKRLRVASANAEPHLDPTEEPLRARIKRSRKAYFQRLRSFETLTPYKTAVVGSAFVIAVESFLLG